MHKGSEDIVPMFPLYVWFYKNEKKFCNNVLNGTQTVYICAIVIYVIHKVYKNFGIKMYKKKKNTFNCK